MLEENATPRTANEQTHIVKNGCDTGPNDVDQLMTGIRDSVTRFDLY